MVERDLAKVDTGVRFPSPAPMSFKPLKWGFFCVLIILELVGFVELQS